ncbi:hypothetical protein EKG40_19590 [Pseudomonas moorei]|nr:hypothetical protein EKG40_19590 [Pseudomonas moorei]
MPCGALGFFACAFVGASLLAKNVNDNAGSLIPRGALGFFASRLAPTKEQASTSAREERQR